MDTNIFRPRRFGRLTRTLVLAGAAAFAAPAFAQSNTTINVESSCTVSQDANGHKTVISYHNGKIDHAQVDGQDVPQNRIHRTGDRVQIVDKDGKVVYEGLVPSAAGVQTFGMNPSFGAMAPSFGPPPALPGQSFPTPGMNQSSNQPTPKSMVGLELVRPDPALLGHFGLKQGEATEVWAVSQDLPAAAAGLDAYDLIVAVNGQTPADPSTVTSILSQAEPGKPIDLTIIHQGKRQNVTVTPAPYDQDKLENAQPASIAQGSPMGLSMNTGPMMPGHMQGRMRGRMLQGPGMQGWFGAGPGGAVTIQPFAGGFANQMDPAFSQDLRDAMERLQMMQRQMQQMWQNQGPGMNGWPQPPAQPAPPPPQPKPTTQA